MANGKAIDSKLLEDDQFISALNTLKGVAFERRYRICLKLCRVTDSEIQAYRKKLFEYLKSYIDTAHQKEHNLVKDFYDTNPSDYLREGFTPIEPIDSFSEKLLSFALFDNAISQGDPLGMDGIYELIDLATVDKMLVLQQYPKSIRQKLKKNGKLKKLRADLEDIVTRTNYDKFVEMLRKKSLLLTPLSGFSNYDDTQHMIDYVKKMNTIITA